MGSSLKGHNCKHTTGPRDKMTAQMQEHTPVCPDTEKTTHRTESHGTSHRRVAGPMGRPALLKCHLRGPWHRGFRGTPRHGNRPRDASTVHQANTKFRPQESLSRHLANSSTHQTHHIQTRQGPIARHTWAEQMAHGI